MPSSDTAVAVMLSDALLRAVADAACVPRLISRLDDSADSGEAAFAFALVRPEDAAIVAAARRKLRSAAVSAERAAEMQEHVRRLLAETPNGQPLRQDQLCLLLRDFMAREVGDGGDLTQLYPDGHPSARAILAVVEERATRNGRFDIMTLAISDPGDIGWMLSHCPALKTQVERIVHLRAEAKQHGDVVALLRLLARSGCDGEQEPGQWDADRARRMFAVLSDALAFLASKAAHGATRAHDAADVNMVAFRLWELALPECNRAWLLQRDDGSDSRVANLAAVAEAHIAAEERAPDAERDAHRTVVEKVVAVLRELARQPDNARAYTERDGLGLASRALAAARAWGDAYDVARPALALMREAAPFATEEACFECVAAIGTCMRGRAGWQGSRVANALAALTARVGREAKRSRDNL